MELEGLPEALVEGLPGNEEECVERLVALRWQDGFQCRFCLSSDVYRVAGRPRVRCCRWCRRQSSVTAGTLLHRTRVDLRVWFLAAGLLMRPEGCQAQELAARAGIHVQTAWRILHRLRAAAESGTDFVLRGIVSHASSMLIHLRRPRPRAARPVPIQVVRDGHGCVLIVQDHTPARTIRRAARHVAPDPRRFLLRDPVAVALRRHLRDDHRWVSARWLPRYLAAVAFRESHAGADVAAAVLYRALKEPRRRFEAVAPKMPAHWVRVRALHFGA